MEAPAAGAVMMSEEMPKDVLQAFLAVLRAVTRPWGEVFGLAATLCAFWACTIAWEAATTPPSPCGNCRRDLAAQAALVEEAPWFLLAAVVGWLGASRSAGPAVRVARCAVVVAVVLWCASFGFVQHWW